MQPKNIYIQFQVSHDLAYTYTTYRYVTTHDMFHDFFIAGYNCSVHTSDAL